MRLIKLKRHPLVWKITLVILIVVLILLVSSILGIKVVKIDEISSIFYGDLLLSSNNIPYTVKILKVGDYGICIPLYYNISGIDNLDLVEDLNKEQQFYAIFDIVSGCNYISEQPDPRQLFDIGGDCNAFAIYLKKQLDYLDIPNGFIFVESHIYNWVVLYNRLYRVDLTIPEVSVLSLVDREKLVSFFPELEKYQ